MLLEVLRVCQIGAKALKLGFFKLIECIIKKKMSWCETECKNMCHWSECNKLKSLSEEDKELIRRERRDGGEREERELRKGAEFHGRQILTSDKN